MSEKVSVIIPVYKVEKYLNRCVERVVNQTYSNLEIILVDDGSPDNCPQMCDEWAVKDERIKVIHKENAGLGIARNSGMEMATGEFIMFIDSDDWMAERTVETLLNRLLQDETDMAVCHMYYAYEDGSLSEACVTTGMKDEIVESKELFDFREGRNWSVAAWNKMYRKKMLKDIVYPALKCGEDLWVYPQLVLNCNTVSLVKDPLIYYFQRADSIVHNMTEERKIDELSATLNMLKAIYKEGDKESIYRWFKRTVQQAFYITSSSQIGAAMMRSVLSSDEMKCMWEISERKVKIKLMVMRVPVLFKLFHMAKNWLKLN